MMRAVVPPGLLHGGIILDKLHKLLLRFEHIVFDGGKQGLVHVLIVTMPACDFKPGHLVSLPPNHGMIESAIANGLEPQDYLTKIPTAKTEAELAALMPWKQ